MNTYDLSDTDIKQHEAVAKAFIDDKRKAAIKRELQSLVDDELFNLEDYAASHISGVAAQRAVDFITKVLNGEEKAAAAIFGRGDSSRYRSISLTDCDGEPWACLIHGALFESGEIKLRRKLVEAHADLLRNERIKDLESIVDGLERQVRKTESDLEECRGRIR